MLSSTLWMLCGQARSSCRDTELRVTSLARAREGDATRSDGTNLCGVRWERTVAGSRVWKLRGRRKKEKRSEAVQRSLSSRPSAPEPCSVGDSPPEQSKEMPGAAETLGDSPPPAIPPADAPAPAGEKRIGGAAQSPLDGIAPPLRKWGL